MDLLEICPANACEMAFQIDEAIWKTFKTDCTSAVTGKEKGERKFLKLAERRKNRFQVEGNHRAYAQWHSDIQIPRVRVSEKHRDIRISPWAGSGIRTFRSTPPATFVSQLRSLSLDE